MEQWRIDYNAAMGAANAALSAGNYNAAIDYANKAASLGNTSAAATAAVNLRQQIYSKAGSGYGPGATMGAGAPAAGSGGGGGGGGTDPYAAYLDALNKQREADLLRQRTSAFETMQAILAGFGIDPDGSGLSATIRNWVFQDKPTEWIKVELRKTAAYNQRFPGMAELIKRGQFMSESEYIAQERAYRNVLTGWNLPSGFYDDPTDFGKFIANGVSVKEVDDRVRSAKTFLDSANPAYKQALQELYGVSEGGMLAYVLDADRAQSVIAKQMKQVALSGAAESKGRFDLSADEVAKYAGTLGEGYNSIGQDQINALEKSFSELGQQADQDARLSSIDQEIYNRKDALDAGLLNDTVKQTASQKRAERERNRFRGTSAVVSGTLSRRSGS